MVKVCCTCALAMTLLAGHALALEARPVGPPGVPGRDIAEVPPARPPVEIGYQVEAGAASTRVANGFPQYRTKTTPSSENFAFLKFKNVGPGELRLFTYAYTAIADPATQPVTSVNVAPGVAYGGKIGVVEAAFGYTVQLLPRATPVDAAHQLIVNVAAPNPVLKPTLDVTGEVAYHPNIYAAAGVEHDFKAGRLIVTPRASLGVTGGVVQVFHANDLTLAVRGQVGITDEVYLVVRPAYSLVLAPPSMVTDPSFAGRSTPYVLVGLGARH